MDDMRKPFSVSERRDTRSATRAAMGREVLRQGSMDNAGAARAKKSSGTKQLMVGKTDSAIIRVRCTSAVLIDPLASAHKLQNARSRQPPFD